MAVCRTGASDVSRIGRFLPAAVAAGNQFQQELPRRAVGLFVCPDKDIGVEKHSHRIRR